MGNKNWRSLSHGHGFMPYGSLLFLDDNNRGEACGQCCVGGARVATRLEMSRGKEGRKVLRAFACSRPRVWHSARVEPEMSPFIFTGGGSGERIMRLECRGFLLTGMEGTGGSCGMPMGCWKEALRAGFQWRCCTEDHSVLYGLRESSAPLPVDKG